MPANQTTQGERNGEKMMNRILLVEDDLEISEMLKDYLTAENYQVVCAADGQEACTLFQDSEFDLVLLDLMIPKISGMEVMQHIRRTSVVPIIIVSAKDTETDKTLGLGLGPMTTSQNRFLWWKCWRGSSRTYAGRNSMRPCLPHFRSQLF